jgi:AraC-like DNA-binding protein
MAHALPHPGLRPGVRRYRGFRFDLGRPRRRLEVPVGAATLMLGFGASLRVARVTGSGETGESYTSLLSGLQTSAAVAEHDGQLAGIEVTLTPWAAFSLFDVPMRELSDVLVDPAQVDTFPARALADALAEAPSWTARFAILDAALRSRWTRGPRYAPGVVHAWHVLRRGAWRRTVPELAADVGWSQRHLERLFREQIGLSPKVAARVLRLQHALRLLGAGRPPARTALECGFYDQAHLTRECAAMIGQPPTRFLATRAAIGAGAGPGQLDRLDGEVTSALLTR